MHLYINEAAATIQNLRKNANRENQLILGARLKRLCMPEDYYSLAVIAKRLGHIDLSDFLCEALAEVYTKNVTNQTEPEPVE